MFADASQSAVRKADLTRLQRLRKVPVTVCRATVLLYVADFIVVNSVEGLRYSAAWLELGLVKAEPLSTLSSLQVSCEPVLFWPCSSILRLASPGRQHLTRSSCEPAKGIARLEPCKEGIHSA